MRLENLKSKVLSIAKRMPNGFTYSPAKDALNNRGYAVAAIETQDCIGKAGLYKVIKFCLHHKEYSIGGWINEDGTMQFDASRVYDSIEEAVAVAIENKQRAFYNLFTGKVIMACDYEYYRRVVA